MHAWADDGKPADFLGSRLAGWVLAAQGPALCRRFERANGLRWRMPVTVSWHEQSGLYVVHDTPSESVVIEGANQIMIARRERIFRYRRGVADRVQRLAKKYFIDRVPFSDGDFVIDCGANVGEIGLFVKSRAAARVIAVEPSPSEANACDENLFGGRPETVRQALWHVQGEQAFYDSNTTGDSSLIAPASTHTNITQVRTTTLDQLAADKAVDRIKLLKIEAEGAEPEILAGGAAILSRVAYCTVDCGPERGASEAHVIPDVCNRLIGANFELLDVNLERQIFWFRNRRGT